MMGDQKRTAVRNAGAFLGPDLGGGGGMIPVPVNSMSAGTGPGEPGPEDDWKIPAWPEDAVEPAGVATPEPAQAGHGPGLLQRLTHRG